MPKVTYLPFNITVEGQEGENLLDLALRHDLKIEHNCGGNCACSTCHVVVREGFDSLAPSQTDEEDQLDEAEGLTLTSRLSCQAKLSSKDLIVFVPQGTQEWRLSKEH